MWEHTSECCEELSLYWCFQKHEWMHFFALCLFLFLDCVLFIFISLLLVRPFWFILGLGRSNILWYLEIWLVLFLDSWYSITKRVPYLFSLQHYYPAYYAGPLFLMSFFHLIRSSLISRFQFNSLLSTSALTFYLVLGLPLLLL